MGGVHQGFPYGICHAVWVGRDAGGGWGLAHGDSVFGGDELSGGGEDGGDGFQPIGGLADRPAESPDGGAVDLGDEIDGLADRGGGGSGVGGRSVATQSTLSDPESGGSGDRLFLFPDEEVYLGIPRIFGIGLGDGSGGGVVGGEGAV